MDIIIENLNKSFGGQQVLEGFSMVIPEGRRSCVMAPSGAGKTTLLRILAGLEKADSGVVTGLEGLKISAVFQEDRLIEGSDAYTNAALAAGRKISRSELKELFAAIGLEDYENKPVSKLSGGMKRRVAISRALCADYDLLLLDEPFKGLDEALKQKVMEFVKQKTEGKTVLLVTHEKSEAEALGATIHNI